MYPKIYRYAKGFKSADSTGRYGFSQIFASPMLDFDKECRESYEVGIKDGEKVPVKPPVPTSDEEKKTHCSSSATTSPQNSENEDIELSQEATR